jgi:DNA-directed RNA polymerase subunit RPC12/RpoP
MPVMSDPIMVESVKCTICGAHIVTEIPSDIKDHRYRVILSNPYRDDESFNSPFAYVYICVECYYKVFKDGDLNAKKGAWNRIIESISGKDITIERKDAGKE